jgi:hypothetical protein
MAACGTTAASQVTADIQLVDTTAAALIPALTADGVAVPAALTAAIAAIEKDASAIGTAAVSPLSASSIENDIDLLASAASVVFPAAAAIVPIVDSLVAIGTAIVSAVGGTASVSLAKKYTPRTVYAATDARANLRAFVATKR